MLRSSLYPIKENPIGSAVSEILRYKHTHKHTDKQTYCYFIRRIYIQANTVIRHL